MIKEIYNIVCSIIDVSYEEYPITYERIESGCILVFLAGHAVALGIIGGMIKFSYEVYKDQFSWKAKQEKTLGEIKVRGEYLKLIKEQNEASLGIILTDPELQGKLAEIENANIKLFSNNPSAILNGEKIGVPLLGDGETTNKIFLIDGFNNLEDRK